MQAGRRSRMSLGGDEHLQWTMIAPDDAARLSTIVVGANKENAAADALMSFLSAASSSTGAVSSRSGSGDMLNQGDMLSDITELTPTNFLLQARSRQYMQSSNNKHARDVTDAAARSSKKVANQEDKQHAVSHQDKDSMEALAMEEAEMAVEARVLPRPSLPAATTGKNRHKTPATTPCGFQLTQASEMDDDIPLSTCSHRETLFGPIPGGTSSAKSDNEKSKIALRFAAQMRERREKRKMLAPGAFSQLTAHDASDVDDTIPLSTRSHRETLLGPIPGGISTAKTDTKANETTKHALRFAAEMRERREKRQKDRDSKVRERLSTGSSTMSASLEIPQPLLGGPGHTADDSSTTTELPISPMRTKDAIDDGSSTALDLPASLLAAVTKPGS